MDFFPIGKIEIPNFPNTKKIILAELHFKKIKIKIREPFFLISTERARLARVESQHRTCKTRWGRRYKGNPL